MKMKLTLEYPKNGIGMKRDENTQKPKGKGGRGGEKVFSLKEKILHKVRMVAEKITHSPVKAFGT